MIKTPKEHYYWYYSQFRKIRIRNKIITGVKINEDWSVLLIVYDWKVCNMDGIGIYYYIILISRVKTRAIASFDATNQQIWVNLWGPCVLGVYYIMIIIKISKKRILIGRIFHFRRCQIILWRDEMEPFDRAWFGCCPSGRIPSDDYEIPTCSSNDVTRSAEHWAYPSSKSLKTDANWCTKRRECLPLKIT